MKRKKKLRAVTIAGVTGLGETKTTAHENAVQHLSRIVENVKIGPRIEVFRDYVTLVWPSGEVWSTAMIQTPDRPVKSGSTIGLPTTTGYSSHLEAAVAARNAMAQMAWNHGVDDDDAFVEEAFSGLPPAVHHESRLKAEQLRSWISWQRRYKAALDAGLSAEEAYDRASLS